jgi:hypothetical protein
MKLKVGTKVRVTIKDTSLWAQGAPEALNGMTGTVEEIQSAVDVWGRVRVHESPFLVRFDKAAPKWWTHQSPALAWHFGEADLTVIG